MTTNPAIQALRRIPIMFVLAFMLLVTLLFVAEASGGSPKSGDGVELPFVNTKTNKPDNSNGSNGNHEKHCTDGHGQDHIKNKHCRGISGAR